MKAFVIEHLWQAQRCCFRRLSKRRAACDGNSVILKLHKVGQNNVTSVLHCVASERISQRLLI